MEINAKQVCEDILLLVEYMKPAVQAVSERHGLTPPQVWALHCVSCGHRTMGAVAGKLHCDASNVTGIIDRLVSQKLVVRAESEHDRRTKKLELTPRGHAVVEDLWQSLITSLRCDRLSPADRAAFHELINKLTQTV